ncbi:MAG: CoA-binding protein [Chlorobia bacterium]|nr:CoA-binding protein [Fimbriimonadaceae bacterium]
MEYGASTACSITLNTRLTPEQREKFQNTKLIRQILGTAKTIAVVGLSTESTKASNMVASYLQDEGYRIIPVNPRATEILGEECYPDLRAIPFPVDVVDIFRPATEVPDIVQDAIDIGAQTVWMQLRLVDIPAAERAQAAGLNVVADKCIKMEHGRFGGMLHWAGMNTEVISARRRKTG